MYPVAMSMRASSLSPPLCASSFRLFFNRRGHRPRKAFSPHGGTGLLLANQRLVTRELMRLNSNQHVEVLVVSSVLNEVLQSIAAFEKNGTFSALVRIEVESECVNARTC